jgi:phage FluMu protein gp41
MVKMSELCKMSLTKEFGFKESELRDIEVFMNDQNQKTTKDVLDALIKNKKLSNKQKILISYGIGNSARESAIREEQQKGITLNIPGKVTPIGG